MAFYHTQVGGIPILIPGMHGQRSKQSIIYDKKDDIKVKSKNLYSSCKTDTAIWRKNVGTEKEQLQLERTELRMLRWLMGVSLRERRRSENIRAETGVVPIVEKAREARLRWYGHVIRMEEDDPVKVAWRSQVEGRSKGRQRIRWRDVIE